MTHENDGSGGDGAARRILAISGSLRRASVNHAALRAAARAAPPGVVVAVDDSLRRLPHFDPDLEASPPEEVRRFHAACEEAAGVLLSVPEYAFGIPGSFKNALDWTVRSGSLHQKPVSVLEVAARGRGRNVRQALELVLTAIDADVSWRSVPIVDRDRDPSGEVTAPAILAELGTIVAELAARPPRSAP